jgi:hypothetical protein
MPTLQIVTAFLGVFDDSAAGNPFLPRRREKREGQMNKSKEAGEFRGYNFAQ